MRYLCDNAASRRRVDPLDRLVELGDTETLDDSLLLFRVADHAPVILDLDLAVAVCFYFLCHNSPSFELVESVEFVATLLLNILNQLNTTLKLILLPVCREAVRPRSDPSF